ncbi:hypothetical protein [Rhizobium sp. RCC_161_2]|uniref:hypothetical protein n=1 Tax=Rhizobium sp. RCC_161_2 TaxID=3239219 RepID=UPI003526BADF
MPQSDLLREPAGNAASLLEAMTDDDVFGAMNVLETISEDAEEAERDEILSRIVLVEEEIERRFPGQVLAPYRDWKKNQPLL